MTYFHKVRHAAVAAAALALVGGAQAAGFVDSGPTFAPTTELISFDSYDGLLYDATLYPTGLALESGGIVRLTTVDGGALIGAFVQDLEGNGLWGARFDVTPTGIGNFLAATQTINFDFGTHGPQARVGAFFNLSQPLSGPKGNQITLTALDGMGAELESFSFGVDTDAASYNEGVFAGFDRTSADIASFRVSFTAGGSVVMDELHLTAVPVPEASTWAMMVAGLAAMGALARRRRA